jgi:hypothetical protein
MGYRVPHGIRFYTVTPRVLCKSSSDNALIFPHSTPLATEPRVCKTLDVFAGRFLISQCQLTKKAECQNQVYSLNC